MVGSFDVGLAEDVFVWAIKGRAKEKKWQF